jgi:hypothetical protein
MRELHRFRLGDSLRRTPHRLRLPPGVHIPVGVYLRMPKPKKVITIGIDPEIEPTRVVLIAA